MDGSRAALQAIDRDEFDALSERPIKIVIGPWHADFVAETFLTTFTLPIFYFHAATAYGILRSNGMDIGKADFTGKLEVNKD